MLAQFMFIVEKVGFIAVVSKHLKPMLRSIIKFMDWIIQFFVMAHSTDQEQMKPTGFIE